MVMSHLLFLRTTKLHLWLWCIVGIPVPPGRIGIEAWVQRNRQSIRRTRKTEPCVVTWTHSSIHDPCMKQPPFLSLWKSPCQ
ncbi:hypothetical protein DL96DRAFT_1581121 [Flagelloscypha sp. PMI_526]|nr:hypothetical protein DL96DRAFT_1581121 [Flagelloscypha sp. PMI_526]